jgi:ribonuclease Y
MHLTVLLIEGAVVFIIGGALGYVVRHYVAVSRRGSVESDIEEKLLQAKRDARLIEDEALTKARELREEMKRTEDRIVKQEERLDKREQELIKKDTDLAHEITSLKEKGKELQQLKEKIEEKEKSITKELEKVAGLSHAEAQAILLRKIANESEEDLQSRALKQNLISLLAF